MNVEKESSCRKHSPRQMFYFYELSNHLTFSQCIAMACRTPSSLRQCWKASSSSLHARSFSSTPRIRQNGLILCPCKAEQLLTLTSRSSRDLPLHFLDRVERSP